MNPAHLHLLVNHLPILGTLFGLLLGIYGAIRRQPPVVRAAFLALIVSGVAGLVAKETGEDAEEIVEHLPGVDRRALHEHEEAADWATWAGLALAVTALGVLVWKRREPDLGAVPTAGVLLLAAVVFALMARTGNLGGEIRHTEIRTGADAGSATDGAALPRRPHDDGD